jgi:GAF domain-containing protein
MADDAFQDLLPTLARGLDVREIFRQLSEVAARIVPHDEANLLPELPDGDFEMFASTASTHEVVCVNHPSHALNTRDPQLLDSVPGPDRELRSGLTVPVRINDRFLGVFALFSSQAKPYTDRDLAQATRLAARVLACDRLHDGRRQRRNSDDAR